MRPTTAVSSANFTIWQSRRAVIHQQSEQEGAQHTALWRASAEGDGGGDGVVDPDSLRSISQEVQDPVPQCRTQTKGGKLLYQGLWDDGIKSRGEIQKEQTNIGVSALQVGEGCVKWRHPWSDFSCRHTGGSPQ